ncbi:hypothetical protein PFLUV_G00220460 [Perca fluviatilis]|uniref:Uncharacterized protein n=1 Tax=Perca fluviatilis TaxID=8168 RepID=A0A6A5EHK7_PERFL|nr:hypothetical protein PFLUV_G00220460 [Perca fluviatilis]
MLKRVGYLWIFYHFFLGICLAHDLPCTVTHESGRTRYSVPEFNETDCYYQWTNGTKFPLATHETPMDRQVAMKSHRTLLIYVCSELIHYNRDCLSETEGRREATCTTNCSGQVNAGLQTGEAVAHYHWIAPTVVSLLLLGLGMGFLYHRFKNRTFRCGNLFYTSVKTEQHA